MDRRSFLKTGGAGLTALALANLEMPRVAQAASAGSSTSIWKFGVMGDTQWITLASDPANQNPNGCAVSVINQLNQQFIDHGVKFVIQVGDLTEKGEDAAIATRALAAQALYDAGIGFFPMRGNHETYAADLGKFNGYAIAAFQNNFPQTQGLNNTFGATNFKSPDIPDLKGMSYSFDFGNPGGKVRFVVIDDWATPNVRIDAAGYPYGHSVTEQQSWIDDRLNKDTRGTEHAIVFSHQNLMGQDHQDTIFNGYTNANPGMQNAFCASLMKNGVGYYISGHDHMHQRSLITSPDGISRVQELICSSDSDKFYTPRDPNDPNWFGQKRAELSLSQELYTVGYYIFTIDGPRVTVEFYSDDHGGWLSGNDYPGPGFPVNVTPKFNFVLKEVWGYSLNGQEFLVPQGTSYSTVVDSFQTTTARILGGTNTSNAFDYIKRPLTKAVNTGWTDVNTWRNIWPIICRRKATFAPVSDFLTLWGMTGLGLTTEPYPLSMSFDGAAPFFGRTDFGIAAQDDKGNWVNAVSLNNGQISSRFYNGPWKPEYGLGSYGIDPNTKTAWAVVNYDGSFAVGRFEK